MTEEGTIAQKDVSANLRHHSNFAATAFGPQRSLRE